MGKKKYFWKVGRGGSKYFLADFDHFILAFKVIFKFGDMEPMSLIPMLKVWFTCLFSKAIFLLKLWSQWYSLLYTVICIKIWTLIANKSNISQKWSILSNMLQFTTFCMYIALILKFRNFIQTYRCQHIFYTK